MYASSEGSCESAGSSETSSETSLLDKSQNLVCWLKYLHSNPTLLLKYYVGKVLKIGEKEAWLLGEFHL